MRTLLLASVFALTGPVLTGCAPLVVGGVGVGAMMVEDRRTPSTYVMDEEIELTAGHRLRQAGIAEVHANFTSFNRRLLVTGEAANDTLKARVEELGRGVPNVRDVINELAIAAPSSYLARSNDGYITAKVKARLIEDKRINALHIKVITERGTVYLMGMVGRAEGDIAAEVAARTSGALKVVKVFEHLD